MLLLVMGVIRSSFAARPDGYHPGLLGRFRSYEQRIAEAEDAMRLGHYGRGATLCAQALDLKPKVPHAATICTIAACRLQDEPKARRYHNLLPAEREPMVRQICLTAGIELED